MVWHLVEKDVRTINDVDEALELRVSTSRHVVDWLNRRTRAIPGLP